MTSENELNILLEHLLDDAEEVRYDAARKIAWELKLPFKRILPLTADQRPRIREMACFIFGCKGYIDDSRQTTAILYPESVATLVLLLNDPDNDVRAAASKALGSHQAPSTLPLMIELAADPSVEVRFAVAGTLGSFYASTWEEIGDLYKADVGATLMRLMDDDDDDVRDWATFGIHQGGHNTPETRARLWKALDDSNPDVRGEAAEGLALFGDSALLLRLDILLRQDEEISPCYYRAAEILGDPALFPAVEAGAERWRTEIEGGEELHPFILSALQALRTKSC